LIDKLATKRRVAERYAAANLESARIIASDPKRYPGLMAEWARRILAAEELAKPGRAA
jgi:hypothetical protein